MCDLEALTDPEARPGTAAGLGSEVAARRACAAILGRRSTRRYAAQPVDEPRVRVLLEVAMAAPSPGDQRPWHVVVTAADTLAALSAVHSYARCLGGAPPWRRPA